MQAGHAIGLRAAAGRLPRAQFREELKRPAGFGNWERITIHEVKNAALKNLEGRTIAQLAAERGRLGLALAAGEAALTLATASRITAPTSSARELGLPQERHLRNVRQLTFGGENAEAYFSPDGRWLIFQSTRDGRSCDR